MTGSIDVAPPIDGVVATAVADAVAIVLNVGRRPSIQGAWIATTARGHDAAAYTPGSDFEELLVRVARVRARARRGRETCSQHQAAARN